jgi:excisionase family DNA binding protein
MEVKETTEVYEMITTEDVAKYFGKDPRWVTTAVSRLGIPHYKLGKQYRFKLHEVEEWLKKQ